MPGPDIKDTFIKCFGIVVASFGTAFALTHLLTIRDAKDPTKEEKNVTLKMRLESADKVLNGTFFTVIAGLAMKAAWELRGTVESRWTHINYTSTWCMCLYCARMAFDLVWQPYALKGQPAKLMQMLMHHLISGIAVGTGLSSGNCHFYASWDITCEATTVFLTNVMAVKAFMAPSPLQGKLVALNGVGLWLGFIAFRLCLFPTWLWWMYKDSLAHPEITIMSVSPFFRVFWPSTNVFLFVLSAHWFVPITTGVLKALGVGGGDKKKDKKDK